MTATWPFTTGKYVTADEQTVATGTKAYLMSVILLPGTLGLAKVDIKIGGSGGTTIFHMEAALGVSAPSWTTGAPNVGMEFNDGIYIDLTGTGAAVQLEYMVP